MEIELYKRVVEETSRDTRDELHPIRYAAGVLYENGDIDVASQNKALEYGNSIDPVTKLVPKFEEKLRIGVRPIAVLQCDQFGNLHAPFAPARSYLSEYGFRDLVVLVHDESGHLVRVKAGELVPGHLECVAATIAHACNAGP